MPTHDHSARNTRRIAYSAGGVIYRAGRVGFEVALIATHQGSRWGLPKGHVRWGESAEDAAVREIEEETGLIGTIERHLATIDYWFRIKNVRVHKYVDFFLVRYTDGTLTPQPSEVDDVRWIVLEDACDLVSFARERDILAQVHQLSDTQQLGDE
ncbi:MAG: hypothetical protein GFH27_549283n212 [Chloroflexi bacterium AL-W]|nr:hypothetical protein [Chloroflexi bacterium AL-N1]NOK64667.1 hypothetical protein [Chloroflexi bacterium AL-N10]NOK75908.1 hypothetical protein [Chloroflexi bacterium AL-N5]NOK80333.1 hypothetical protein [Chloroflexi bacterium AL-W]NOK86846.1 hypothetical protein [Chloroflexi bacterium AL-N15]